MQKRTANTSQNSAKSSIQGFFADVFVSDLYTMALFPHLISTTCQE